MVQKVQKTPGAIPVIVPPDSKMGPLARLTLTESLEASSYCGSGLVRQPELARENRDMAQMSYVVETRSCVEGFSEVKGNLSKAASKNGIWPERRSSRTARPEGSSRVHARLKRGAKI